LANLAYKHLVASISAEKRSICAKKSKLVNVAKTKQLRSLCSKTAQTSPETFSLILSTNLAFKHLVASFSTEKNSTSVKQLQLSVGG